MIQIEDDPTGMIYLGQDENFEYHIYHPEYGAIRVTGTTILRFRSMTDAQAQEDARKIDSDPEK